jgi:hypothetical protein
MTVLADGGITTGVMSRGKKEKIGKIKKKWGSF